MRAPLVRRVVVIVALVVAALIVFSAIAPHLLWPLDPFATAWASFLPPSAEHPLGTDGSGRDLLARVLAGARHSLTIGVGASVIALIVGGLIGVFAGYAGRRTDVVVSRAVEVSMALPEFLLALVVVAILGPSSVSLFIGVAVGAIPAYVRLARAQTRVAASGGAVLAARVLGVAPLAIARRHVVPHVAPSLIGLATIGVGSAVIAAAGLSFLGLGPQPPTPEWGVMLSDAKNDLGRGWWVVVFPGLAITLTVVTAAVLGRELQRVMIEPRTRREARHG